jgi:hypothetical protein
MDIGICAWWAVAQLLLAALVGYLGYRLAKPTMRIQISTGLALIVHAPSMILPSKTERNGGKRDEKRMAAN